MANRAGFRPFRRWAIAILLSVAGIHPAVAHEGRPLYLSIAEQPDGAFIARMRVPPTVAVDNLPALDLPGECHAVRAAGPLRDPATWAAPVRFRCRGGPGGKRLEIRYPLANPAVTALVRLVREDGSELVEILPPDQTGWTMPGQPDTLQVARDYFGLGVAHIWSGLDHLLFVAGMVLLAGTWRRILWTVTGFAIAHSATLALATLGLARVAVAPTEAAIALSVVFLARELVDPRPDTLAKRFPMVVACAFGLLHGFGFAAVLTEIGLPRAQIAIGLLFFNLGVEAGQVTFVALLLAGTAIVRSAFRRSERPGRWQRAILVHQRALCAYGLGIIATFWFIERTTAFL